ncbi:MAG: hypothetical protein VW547_15985, partial [Alphaproteobacteria bacterium]
MLFYPKSKDRPFHLGSYPLEVLPRDDGVLEAEAARPRATGKAAASAAGPLGDAAVKYSGLFERFIEEAPVEKEAPVPADLDRRVQDVKGCAYFM